MTIYDEAQNLEDLTPFAKSLIKYTESLETGLNFVKKSEWWLPDDDRNFIGFQFHWKRTLNITLSLWGEPDEHLTEDSLEIKQGRYNYSEARITGYHQSMAACISIWRAHELYERKNNPMMRERKKSPLILTDSRYNNLDNWLRPRPIPPAWMDCGTPYMMDFSEWINEVEKYAKANGLRNPGYIRDKEFLDRDAK